jgi:hypothetical protein
VKVKVLREIRGHTNESGCQMTQYEVLIFIKFYSSGWAQWCPPRVLATLKAEAGELLEFTWIQEFGPSLGPA